MRDGGLTTFFDRLLQSSSLSLKYTKSKIVTLSTIVIIFFPMYYFIWKYIWPEKYENLELRLIGSLGFFFLLFVNRIEAKHKKLASIIWLIVFTYALSFFFQYMLLKNEISSVWVASSIIAILLMSVISYDYRMLYFMYTAGTFLACIAYYFTEQNSAQYFLKAAGQIPIQGFCLFFSVFLNSKSEQLFEEKRRILEATNERLTEFDRKKDEFLANTSHELRTPLNGILGLTNFLLRSLANQVSKDRILDLKTIQQSANRLLYLVNDILDFSKMSRNEFNLSISEVHIADVIQKLQPLLEPQLKTKSKPVDLMNELNNQIPNVLADENRLQQILYNLIGNAIKFTHEGNIRIYAEPQGDFLKICVADTGIGIASDKLEAIFNPFEQADGSISRSYGGTGLGLSVSKQLVELQKGQMGVTSTPGQGSIFYFTLPIADQDHLTALENAAPIHEETITPYTFDEKEVAQENNTIEDTALAPLPGFERLHLLKQSKILVVDDDSINIMVTERHLTSIGASVISAQNGETALELIKTQSPDLVLLDIMMPGMTGYEVAEKIRAEISDILPIVMLTALTRESNALYKGFMTGATDFLSKPYDETELFMRLESALHQQALFKIEKQTYEDKLTLLKGLAAGIAHETKTPVGLMMMNADMGSNVAKSSETLQDCRNSALERYTKIYRIGTSAIQIIDLVLNNMKNQVIEEIFVEKLQALDAVKQAVAEYGFGYKFGTGLEQRVMVKEGGDFEFIGASTVFTYIMFNLLKNAVYYMSETNKNHVDIWLEPGELDNKIYFKDYGPGIKPDILPHIFESFMSVGKKDGTGLGLPFCKRAMEAFGGDILCDTKPGEYTAFILVFPKIK